LIPSPLSVKVTHHGRNVLTGQEDVALLMKIKKSHVWPPAAQQNYLTLPGQRWLGNHNGGDGAMKQFTPLDLDDTAGIEDQLDGSAPQSITLSAYPLLKGDAEVYITKELRQDTPPPIDLYNTPEGAGLADRDVVYLRSKRLPGARPATLSDHGIQPHAVLQLEILPAEGVSAAAEAVPAEGPKMEGFSGGGTVSDKVFPDLRHGPEKWDVDVEATATVHLVNSRVFLQSTGRPMPETDIAEGDYSRIRIPGAYQAKWDSEPDTVGIYSREVSEVISDRPAGMFQSRACLVAHELRK